jgi:glyoxylase-like metal-dependent hydrolase (beta-lactamase superfamily II)
MKVKIFNITNFKVDGGAMFGVVPKVLWSRVYHSDEKNLISLSLRSLIIETAGRVVLVDTGWGDKQDEKFFRHAYLHGGDGLIEGLKQHGYSPGEITDVVLTHLHADHCGGCVKNTSHGPELVFPNAIHHVSQAQWDWAVKNNLREEDAFLPENFMPLAEKKKLSLIDSDSELFDGFAVRLCSGHTPGLMIPVITYNGRKMVFTGDLIPTSAHIPLIWNMSYDIESLKTIEEKKRLLDEAIRNDYVLIFQHDINIECCTVEHSPKGAKLKEIFLIQDVGC